MTDKRAVILVVSLLAALGGGALYLDRQAAAKEPGQDDGIQLVFWDNEYFTHSKNGAYKETKTRSDAVLLTLDEVTGRVQSIEDRLQTLEKTIAACCGTETMDPRASGDLELMVKLRLGMEELEARLKTIEGQ